MTLDLLARIHGCIAGLAVGDAIGMPGQPTPQTTHTRNGGWIETLLPSPADDVSGHSGLPAGQATDDTTAMLAIVRSIIREGTVNESAIAQALIEWVEELGGLDVPYIGPSTKRAIKALRDGVSPRLSGIHGTTNGAAMRVAPIGFLYAPDLEATTRAAVASAYPTHATATACSGAAAVACAVAEAIQPHATIESILNAAKKGADWGEALGVESLAPSISRRIEWAVELVRQPKSDVERLRDIYDLVGMGMATYETVPASLAVWVMADGDPQRGMILAANMGGDTDTTAAIVGALGGAYRGIDALSAPMVAQVEQVNGYDFAQIARDYLAVVQRLQQG